MAGSLTDAEQRKLGESVQRLLGLGLHLREEWASRWALGQRSELSLDGDRLDASLLREALGNDLKEAARPALPPDLHLWHKRALPGRIVLQVEEAKNVAHNAEDRETRFGDAKRCISLWLTDGHTVAQALELERCEELSGLRQGPPGRTAHKVVIQGAPEVRRGLILLRPHNVHVLGGYIDPSEEKEGRAAPERAPPRQAPQEPKQEDQLLDEILHNFGDQDLFDYEGDNAVAAEVLQEESSNSRNLQFAQGKDDAFDDLFEPPHGRDLGYDEDEAALLRDIEQMDQDF